MASGDNDTVEIFSLSVNAANEQPVAIATLNASVQAVGSATLNDYGWSPDGRTIAFIAADAPREREGDEQHNRSFEVIDNHYLATAAPVSSHIWLVAASGGEARRLTSGIESVKGIGWLRDGESIAFVSQPRPYDGEFLHASSKDTAITTINVANGVQHSIVPELARVASAPQSSPRGNLIAYLQFRGTESWTRPKDVAVISPSGEEARILTGALDRDIAEFAWMADGGSVVLVGTDGTRRVLWQQPLDGAAQQLALGNLTSLSSLSISDTGALAFIGSQALVPAEVYIMSSRHAKPRRLTQFNSKIASLDLGRLETVRWKQDGFEQTGTLLYPPGFNRGEKVPLVLNLHGGPESTSIESFDLFDQLLASQGWAVFKPNYRGSNSQGEAFQSAIVGDLGEGPGRDVMAGIAAVKALGLVDEDRIALSGWSYGGYMTAWLIGQHQGWAAAVAGAPLTHYLDWYNLSCCSAWAEPTLGGSPWLNDNITNYWWHSPVAYAKAVKTPTLILARADDPMAPVTQSYSLYHALRDNGVKVSFIVHPVGGHGIGSDPVHERDIYRRWISWIEQHFRAPPKGKQ